MTRAARRLSTNGDSDRACHPVNFDSLLGEREHNREFEALTMTRPPIEC
jgi:hypothetical protein